MGIKAREVLSPTPPVECLSTFIPLISDKSNISPLFAIAFLLAIVVMIDAMGVRQETGKQSRALNQILEELFSDTPDKIEMHFKELIGHTPLQVFFGALTGVGTALLLSLIPGIR